MMAAAVSHIRLSTENRSAEGVGRDSRSGIVWHLEGRNENLPPWIIIMRLRTAAGFPAAVFYRNSKHRKGRETVQSAMAACRRVWKLSSKAKAGCIFNVGAGASDRQKADG